MMLELSEHEDILLASSATGNAMAWPLVGSGAACAPVITTSREYPDAILALFRRINGTQQLRQPAAWLKERSEVMHLDSMCLSMVCAGLSISIGLFEKLPPSNAAWEELLAESIHICKVNMEAELSAQPRMSFDIIFTNVFIFLY